MSNPQAENNKVLNEEQKAETSSFASVSGAIENENDNGIEFTAPKTDLDNTEVVVGVQPDVQGK